MKKRCLMAIENFASNPANHKAVRSVFQNAGKKALHFMLSLVLFVLIIIPQSNVWASNTLKGTSTEQVVALLRQTDTGKMVELPVIVRYGRVADREIVDYEVTIASSYLKSVSKWDSTYAVKATLRMAFREKFINGIKYVAVDNYSAMWEKSDNTVSIRNSYIRPGVAGLSEHGTPYSTSYQYWVGIPTLNTYYYTYPSWRGVFINMQDEVGNHSAHLYSQLIRGNSSWTLQFCIGLGQGTLVCL
ncbi:MAG: hypothetical protein AB1453_05425 [Chloroflexota bacterium]|jgi:hypothetical protein